MSNMSQADRNAIERMASGGERTRGADGPSRGTAIFLAFELAVLAALSYAAVRAFHGWDHLVVIADLLIFTAAIAVWVRGRTEEIEPIAPVSYVEGWRPTKGI